MPTSNLPPNPGLFRTIRHLAGYPKKHFPFLGDEAAVSAGQARSRHDLAPPIRPLRVLANPKGARIGGALPSSHQPLDRPRPEFVPLPEEASVRGRLRQRDSSRDHAVAPDHAQACGTHDLGGIRPRLLRHISQTTHLVTIASSAIAGNINSGCSIVFKSRGNTPILALFRSNKTSAKPQLKHPAPQRKRTSPT
jgi:hypothetical protein